MLSSITFLFLGAFLSLFIFGLIVATKNRLLFSDTIQVLRELGYDISDEDVETCWNKVMYDEEV
ncbi:MAG: hypothetical protein H0Z24_05490 [Thermosipho sp. (in: Bacteria)]|nr:hypothetical protein [Thermosipho sp. (in: thermotogales)]